MRKKILSFEDLEVYQKLCKLHLNIHELTFQFPEIELHELGYQLRKLSNSAPACIAEGYSIKTTRYYLEKINKSLGELRQTKHYINIAFNKSYIEETMHAELINQYDECGRMLKALEKSIKSRKTRNNTFTKNLFPNNYHL